MERHARDETEPKAAMDRGTRLGDRLRKTWGRLSHRVAATTAGLRKDTERVRFQVKQIFDSTSDQVLEKAEETRKAVRLRMAVLEMEHHLNRLYPQIGKLLCDRSADGHIDLTGDTELQSRIDLAAEYRQRLEALRQQEARYHEQEKAEEG